mgnify:CR=1 FL=1
MKIAAAIPAKGSSSRVPSKNLQKVLGVPLFLWAANNLSRVLAQRDIYVDSDSIEILEIAQSHGFSTIQRPSDLATNATNGHELMLWQASNIECDVLIQHLPPMLFLREETIRRGIDLIKNGYDSAFALVEEHFYMWDDNGPCYDLKNLPNSFTLPKVGIEGMGFYISRKDVLEKERVRTCGKYAPVAINSFESIDIDYPEDLALATAVAKGLDRNSEYTCGISQYLKRDNIKLLVLDVDGVMTDGGMYYSESGDQLKKFNTKDGIAIKRMVDAGIEVRFLSSGTSANLIAERGKTLGVSTTYCGLEKKTKVLGSWIETLQLPREEIAYIGDDINDLDAMKCAGFVACPSDALEEVCINADVILDAPGGGGCIREFWERFIKS